MGFSRQEHWSGLPFPSPGDLPHPGIEPGSPALQADSLPSEPPGKPMYLQRTQQIVWHKLTGCYFYSLTFWFEKKEKQQQQQSFSLYPSNTVFTFISIKENPCIYILFHHKSRILATLKKNHYVLYSVMKVLTEFLLFHYLFILF